MAISITGGLQMGPMTLEGLPAYSYNFASGNLTISPTTTVGTQAYTVEFWFLLTNATFTSQRGIMGPTSRSTNAFNLRLNNATSVNVDQYVSSAQSFTVPTMLANVWYYFVAVRNSSGATTIFINGTRSSTGAVTLTNNYSGVTASVGGIQDNSLIFPGYISNFRWVLGSAVYDPTLTTMTVPTEPLPVIANTILLTAASSTIVDVSGTKTLTAVGTVTPSRVSPFGAPFNP